MSLSDGLRSNFNSKQIRGGQEHFEAGRVAVLHRSTETVSLEVRDRRKAYFVELSDVGESVRAHCECGTFKRGQLCGHLWAAILTMDEAGIAFASPVPVWRQEMQKMIEATPKFSTPATTIRGAEQTQLVYVLHTEDLGESDTVKIRLYERTRRSTGDWGKPRKYYVDSVAVTNVVDAHDREILALLGARHSDGGQWYRYNEESKHALALEPGVWDIAIPKIANSGRFFWRENGREPLQDDRCLVWDGDEAYAFKLKSTEDEDGNLALHGFLERGDETIAMDQPVLIFATSQVLLQDRLIRFAPIESFVWIRTLRRAGQLTIPNDDREEFSRMFALTPIPAESELAADIQFETVSTPPIPILRVKEGQRGLLVSTVHFRYGERDIEAAERLENVVDAEARRVFRRDLTLEAKLGESLELAVDEYCGSFYGSYEDEVSFPVSTLPVLANHLMDNGWLVDVRGRRLQRAEQVRLKVESNLDWFELGGEVSFGTATVQYPVLLKAIRSGRAVVELSDGTTGLLPTEFLEQHRRFGELADLSDGTVKFQLSQAALLDSLLAVQDTTRYDTDAGFDQALAKIRQFSGIAPVSEPEDFEGTLRGYQKEGLGWLEFLKEFRFGGCLADDMGLGKTVQVLALLAAHYHVQPETTQSKPLKNAKSKQAKEKALTVEAKEVTPDGIVTVDAATVDAATVDAATPDGTVTVDAGTLGKSGAEKPPTRISLVVAPKSLVFNWVDEATKFSPKLRVLNYTGTHRRELLDDLANYHIIITTYGTLRRDILELKEVEFDYAILDEAQAIKNHQSQTAKACRLLTARYRLAMTGTPVENHLGDLWSLFEFLNPGILGSYGFFQSLVPKGDGTQDEEKDSLEWLGKGLRPYILRRTKSQVLDDLPEKLEQTLYCDMEPMQQKLYTELRDFYRASLSERIEATGIKQAKIHVLEALLRLRQVACHPALVDPEHSGAGSAKLALLMAQLEEVTAEGHKVLIFSQFTSFLALVKPEMEKRGIVYEYLDGRTRNREQRVKRFQADKDCSAFLISLKAGGHGLNLTAADYVFILDPWWNPAVEAQAIDRVHRIGQTKRVFAYRIICRDTVEDKILKLQQRKKDLAEAIITENNSVIRNLTQDDLAVLFGD
jgi:superfamily II DNA or RNA helicase